MNDNQNNNIINNNNENDNDIMTYFLNTLNMPDQQTTSNNTPNISTQNTNQTISNNAPNISTQNTNQTIPNNVPNISTQNTNQTIPNNVPNISTQNTNTNQIIVNNTSPHQEKNTVEIDYLQSYIGENYEKFLANRFNIGAFFFGIFYFLYRKMYLYAITIIILIILISFLLNIMPFKIPMLALIIEITISIIIGSTANNIYLSFAEKKVNKIISKNKNLNLIELQKKCQKKGRTNKLILFSPLFLIITIFLISTYETRNTINKNKLNRIIEEVTLSNELVREAYYQKKLHINNIFDLAESEYIFENTNITYYISPTLAKELNIDEKKYSINNMNKTTVLDASIINYNAINKVFITCLVINKQNELYSSKYTTRKDSSINNIKIPKNTMYVCSNDTKSWE